MSSQKQYTDDEILELLVDASGEVEGTLSMKKFNEYPGPISTTVSGRFGSWNKAKEKAGIETHPYRQRDVSIPECRDRIQRIKRENVCQSCSDDRAVCAMDFHHIDSGEKRHNLSHMPESGYSWEEVVEELENCVLLCAACHKEVEHGVRPCPSTTHLNQWDDND